MKTKQWKGIEKQFLGVAIDREIHKWLRSRSHEEDKSMAVIMHEILSRARDKSIGGKSDK